MDGTIASWGPNDSGQLGNGTTIGSSDPVYLSFSSSIQSVAAGLTHSLALADDRTIYAWGHNTYGQLGNNSTTNSSVPIQLSSISQVSEIAGGSWYSLARTEDGTLYAWGSNSAGQLGDGTCVQRSKPTPCKIPMPGLNGVTMVGGQDHTLALYSDGSVWAWGSSYYGQLGFGASSRYSSPQPGSTLASIAGIVAEDRMPSRLSRGRHGLCSGI